MLTRLQSLYFRNINYNLICDFELITKAFNFCTGLTHSTEPAGFSILSLIYHF